MMVGTLLHEWLERRFKLEQVISMSEINVTPWMPPGWGGTADHLIFDPEYKRYHLMDVKTTKGESMPWIAKDGIKKEHVHQVSSYFHACEQMGLPMMPEASILYWPITNTSDNPLPTTLYFTPLAKDDLGATMRSRREAADRYKASLPTEALAMAGQVHGEDDWGPDAEAVDYSIFHTDELAPVADREQVLHRNRSQGVWDLKSKPHWSSMFCDYPGKLCGCKFQDGMRKIGHYDTGGGYTPRKGFETEAPTIEPSETL